MINAAWMSQAIFVAARLGIADRLADGPRTSDELAAAVGAHGDALYRLLRGLASLGLCRESDGRLFQLTPLGGWLRSEGPRSLRAWALFWGEALWPAWGTLIHSVKTGQSIRPLASRTKGFENLALKPEASRTFNDAMAGMARLIAASLIDAYSFSDIHRLVDVGGGYGELLAAILRAYPSLHGVLFDLPHVVDGAGAHLRAAGVADRCEIAGGSFLDRVPEGGDAYCLKSVIHDWDDLHSHTILEHCRRVIPPGGKLLLIERILPDMIDTCAEHRGAAASDLNMLVAIGGRERTEREYRELLGSAAFTLTRTVPIAAYYSVIEAAPVDR
jgi:hypothetical protein